MDIEIGKFVKQLPSNCFVIFYYSGHGVQFALTGSGDASNFLLPVDIPENIADVEIPSYSINLDLAMGLINRQNTDGPKIFILDACRSNPFSTSKGYVVKGLADISKINNTIIGFAAEPGKVACDGGVGNLSPYTQTLIKIMQKPGLKIEEVFSDVRKEMIKEGKCPSASHASILINENYYFTMPANKVIDVNNNIPSNSYYSGSATLRVKVEDSGVLYINGEYICKINPGTGKDVEVPAGKVNLKFQYSSTQKKHEDTFNIGSGETRPYTIGRSYGHSEIKRSNAKAHLISIPLPGSGRKYVGGKNQWYPSVVFWGGIGGGIACYKLSDVAYQKYENESDPVQSQKLLDNSRMYQNIAITCIGISAAMMIVEQIVILTSKGNGSKSYGKANLNVPDYAMFSDFSGEGMIDKCTGFTRYNFDGRSGLGYYYDIYPMVNQVTLYPASTNLFGIKLNTGLQETIQIQYLLTKNNED